MDRDAAERLVAEVAERWVADPANDVVYTEYHDGRRAVRVAQQVRDFTTIWFEVGDRSVRFEAYVLPVPPETAAEVHRQALFRNFMTWRVHFAIDPTGELYLRGRADLDRLDPSELEAVLAEVYELIEVSFRPLLRAAFAR